MLANEILKTLDCFRLGDVKFHRLLPDVEVNFARSTTDVAEIGIRHFSHILGLGKGFLRSVFKIAHGENLPVMGDITRAVLPTRQEW